MSFGARLASPGYLTLLDLERELSGVIGLHLWSPNEKVLRIPRVGG